MHVFDKSLTIVSNITNQSIFVNDQNYQRHWNIEASGIVFLFPGMCWILNVHLIQPPVHLAAENDGSWRSEATGLPLSKGIHDVVGKQVVCAHATQRAQEHSCTPCTTTTVGDILLPPLEQTLHHLFQFPGHHFHLLFRLLIPGIICNKEELL